MLRSWARHSSISRDASKRVTGKSLRKRKTSKDIQSDCAGCGTFWNSRVTACGVKISCLSNEMQLKGDGVFMRIYEDIKIAERSLTQLILLVAFPANAEYQA